MTPLTDREQVMRDEGIRWKPYLDSEGIWTIGRGHNLTVGGISTKVADLIFEEDFATITTRLEFLLPDLRANLSPVRWGVLLNMGFNLGPVGLLGFHNFLAALRGGQWRDARDAMLDSRWARQVGDRATRLARQIVEDQRV